MEDDYKSIIPEECRWRNWAHDDGSGHALTGDDLLLFVNNVVFDKLKKIEITPDTPICSFKPIEQQGPNSQPGNIRIKSGDEGLHLNLMFDFR